MKTFECEKYIFINTAKKFTKVFVSEGNKDEILVSICGRNEVGARSIEGRESLRDQVLHIHVVDTYISKTMSGCSQEVHIHIIKVSMPTIAVNTPLDYVHRHMR